MVELRWVLTDANGKNIVRCTPTATDALEFAEKALNNSEEFVCCKDDVRLKNMKNIKTLIEIN